MTFTELMKFESSNRFTELDNNKEFTLYRSEYFFRGSSEYTTYLVNNSSDEYIELSSNRVKKIQSALKKVVKIG